MDWHTLLCCKHCAAKQAQLPWFPVCSPDVFCLCRPPVSWESWSWGWKSIFTGRKPDIFACYLSQISCHKEAGPWWTLTLLRIRNISAHCSCMKRTGRQNIHSLNTLLGTLCLYWVVLASTRIWKCSSEILLRVDMWTSNHVYRIVSSTFKLPSSSTATSLRRCLVTGEAIGVIIVFMEPVWDAFCFEKMVKCENKGRHVINNSDWLLSWSPFYHYTIGDSAAIRVHQASFHLSS